MYKYTMPIWSPGIMLLTYQVSTETSFLNLKNQTRKMTPLLTYMNTLTWVLIYS